MLQTSEPEKAVAEILKPLPERLPTQTWRSGVENYSAAIFNPAADFPARRTLYLILPF